MQQPESLQPASYRWAALCTCLLIAVLLSSAPFGNYAFNDDWSFFDTARGVALTGVPHYNGWSEPSIGVQAYWGALFLRLFGFSYQVLRFSTLPVAAGCLFLLFALGRKFHLPTSYTALGSLAVMASPLIIPLSVSFMTEVPSMFLLLIVFYAGMSALQTSDRRAMLMWMGVMALASVAGGTVRQIGYFPALLSLPLIGLRLRRVPRALTGAALFWLLTAASLVVFETWYKQQPGSVTQPMLPTVLIALTRLHDMLLFSVVTVVTVLELILPVAAAFLIDWHKVERRFLIAIAIAGAAFFFYARISSDTWIIVPFGNIVSIQGVMGNLSLIGTRPFIAKGIVYVLATVLAILCAGLAWRALGKIGAPGEVMRQFTRRLTHPPVGSPSTGEAWLLVFLPFIIVYPALAIVHGTTLGYFDRYLVPVLPGLVLGALYLYRCYSGGARIPAVCWLLLGCFAFYGVAGTHDYWSERRAVEEMAARLERRGIPPTRITAGFEHDAVSQMNAAGRVRSAVWELATGTLDMSDKNLDYCWFLAFAPALHPQYFVTAFPTKKLVDANFGSIPFRTWLPPFRGEARVRVKGPDFDRPALQARN